MPTIDDRWAIRCDLCGKADSEKWCEDHCTMGGIGFNFTFCFECNEHKKQECVKCMSDCMSRRRKECFEYWATHPEELAKHNKETEEYRNTLKDWK